MGDAESRGGIVKHLARGIMYLYPSCIWIFVLVGVVTASHLNGNSEMAGRGAGLLICFSVAVLVAAFTIGYLLREKATEVKNG